jgi:hypothetical protein
LCPGNVPFLTALGTASQQDDGIMLNVVHPVTGTIVDAKFRHALTNGLNVAGVAEREPPYPNLNARPYLAIG